MLVEKKYFWQSSSLFYIKTHTHNFGERKVVPVLEVHGPWVNLIKKKGEKKKKQNSLCSENMKA